MLFNLFNNTLREYGIFSTSDIKKHFPKFDRRRLSEWQDKEYIYKIRNSYYCFPEFIKHNNSKWLIANFIYKPSYISMESALAWYQIIPEGVFSVTSITTNKTQHYATSLGNYFYNTVKSSLYFGYTLMPFDNLPNSRSIIIADIEKSILDFLYIKSYYNTESDIRELRFNSMILNNEVSKEKIYNYLNRFKNKALENRINLLFKLHL